MVTISQIKAAHSKVKSGADFPAYVLEIIQLGVLRYENFVGDGHTVYFGANGFAAQSEAKYAALEIAAISNKARAMLAAWMRCIHLPPPMLISAAPA